MGFREPTCGIPRTCRPRTYMWSSANLHVGFREPACGVPRTYMWGSANLHVGFCEPTCAVKIARSHLLFTLYSRTLLTCYSLLHARAETWLRGRPGNLPPPNARRPAPPRAVSAQARAHTPPDIFYLMFMLFKCERYTWTTPLHSIQRTCAAAHTQPPHAKNQPGRMRRSAALAEGRGRAHHRS